MNRKMTKGLAILAMILTPILILAGIFASHNAANASSHREAPLISKDPFADNTDTYIFIPAGQTENIAIIGSWIPFEGPEGGPNYFEFDDQVRYDLYLDLDGDATAEVTYTLRTTTTIGSPTDTFLYNTGPINSVNDATWNRPQVYSLVEKFEPGMEPAGSSAANVLVNNGRTAPANIGSKSTPNYQSLVNEVSYTYSDPGNGDSLKVFAGQTDDAFWVDLQVFDLLTLRGQAPPIGYTTGNKSPVDSVSGFNVHSIVLEIPISRLVRNGDPVLGMWAGARRVGMGVFSGSGAPVQVSRLGMPLVNEVVLPMGLKDTFNSIPPSVDLTVYGLLQESVENPEIGTLLCALYGVPLPGDTNADCNTEYTPGTPRTGRGDIFDIFLTGMVLANPFTINTAGGPVTLPAGFNVNRPASVTPAEMIRINTAISGDLCAPVPSPLGILGGDACGFPNGRRLTDEVVEIELLAVAGAAYQVLDGRDASFVFNAGLISVLNDGVNGNDVRFAKGFPYMGLAQSGQNHIHKNSSPRLTVLMK